MSVFGWNNWANFSQWGDTGFSGSGAYEGSDNQDNQSVDEQTATAISDKLSFTDVPEFRWYGGSFGGPDTLYHDAPPILSFAIQNPVANETLGFDLVKLASNGLTLTGNQIFFGTTLILTLTETVQNGQIVAISAQLPPQYFYPHIDNSGVQNMAVFAMSSITYEFVGDNPPATDRTILIHWNGDYNQYTPDTQFTIHVNNVNDAPVLIATQAVLTHGFEDISYQIHASDLLTGFSDPENDTLSVSNLISDHGAVTDNGDGTFTLTPEDGYSGDVTLSYHVIDGNGGDLEATLTLTVDAGHFGGTAGDLLDPGTGPQTMFGLAGDDTYVVDDVDDIVVENLDQGIDTVQTALSYTLTANVENLMLTGSGDLSGTGNALDNVLTSNSGHDTLTGGAGDDTYVLTADGQTIVENPGGGTDTVVAGFDYVLGANLENLTLTGSDDIDGAGNSLDNVLTGNSGDNILTGGAGNDRLDGGGGSDDMMGGTGNDTYVVNSTGDDVFEKSNQGIDTVLSCISYTLSDNVENLTLTGTDTIRGTGNSLANTIVGNSGSNVLDGGLGADTMYGGAGDDTYYVDNASDVVSEQTVAGIDDHGVDRIYSTVSYSLPQYVERLYLQGAADINATGNDGDNALYGNTGSNILYGLGGNDYLDGGAGGDVMKGGLGDDTYVVDNSHDNVGEHLDEGTDTVLSSITYTLPSNVENLILTGSDNLNAIGNAVNNIIYGNTGNNLIDGGAGADKMYGGVGDDTYVVSNSFDQANENAGEGTDTVQSSVTFTLGANVENLTLTGAAAINGTGNALANILIGNSGNNVLKGGAGADTFVFGKFGAANGLDHLVDFVTAVDHLSFTGADYGIAAGHHLTNAELSLTGVATSAAGVGQFVYNSTTHTLSWDANGVTAGGMTDIAVFDNGATPAVADFLFT